MKPSTTFVSLCLFMLIFSGCAQAAPPVAVMPEATAQPSVTPAPILATATGTPFPTSRPTATVTLTASPTSAPLTTPIPNDAGLTIEENALVGEIGIEPLTFQPVHGSQQAVMARHAQARQKPLEASREFDNGALVTYPLTGGKQYRTVELVSGREVKGVKIADITVQVQRDGKVIYSTSAGQVSPIGAIRGLWSDGEHWYLEMSYITVSIADENGGQPVYSSPTGQVIRDGVLLNDRYGYAEMIGFQMLAGKPFYFYEKGGQIHLSYNNTDLPIVYDEIPHYKCCSAGELNLVAGPNWVGFFGRRNGVWYYTEIGRY